MAQTIASLPIGAKIKLGKYSVNGESASPIVWLKAGSYYTLTNSVTLLTEKIIDLRPYDAVETQSDMYYPKSYGNVKYSLSNIDQWLNKDNNSGEWFVKTHTYDESPTTTNTQYNTPYTNRPAFLNGFTEDEKSIIVNTPLEIDSQTIQRKVFLLSVAEVLSNTTFSGYQLDYFKNGNSAQAYLTSECFANTTCQIKPSSTSSAWAWLTRSNDASSNIYIILESGTGSSNSQPRAGHHGIRPALNVSSTTLVSDTTDSDGCYTIQYNQAPPTPTNLKASGTLYANKPVDISWDAVVDPDGDEVGYELSCTIDYDDGTTSSPILLYTGTDTSTTHVVPDGISIEYTIKALDSLGAYESEHTVSYEIQHNTPPTISGSDSNLGVKTDGFVQEYVVEDADDEYVTVIEYIDGVVVRTYSADLGVTNTFSIINEEWLTLSNGNHTMTIEVKDAVGDTAIRNYTFTKNVTSFTIQTTPISASTQPTRISLTIGRSIPNGATFVVEVCNNGYDTNPTWEDCTSSILSNLVHTFANTTKTASQWGVMIRVSVNRNGSSGACYVDAIGGNFE